MVNENAKVTSVGNFLDTIQTDVDCPYVIEIDQYYDLSKAKCLENVQFNATTCPADSSA